MGTVVSADSTIIAYEQTGHGPALVLVHGTGRDRSYWARTLPKLAQHASVYAVDRRGRGESGDAEPYSVEREVEDVLAVIDAVAEPVYLLGHSSGAIVALEAAMLTDRLGGLILYELPLGVGTDESHLDLASQLEAMIANGDRETVLVTFLREGPHYPAAEIEAQRRRVDWPDRLGFARTLSREMRATHRYILDPQRASSLRISTLLLVGSESPLLFQQATESLHRALPDSTVVVLEGQHHNAMETAPALFAAAVHRFLQDCLEHGQRPGITA